MNGIHFLGAPMGLLFVFLGLAMIGGAAFLHLRARRRAEASASWPTTVGRIVERRIEHKVETDADGDAQDIWTVHVAYAYAVGGIDRRGERIGFGVPARYETKAPAEALLARFPEGASVPVHYDPADPSEAVLDTTRPSVAKPLLFGVVGLVFVLVGLNL